MCCGNASRNQKLKLVVIGKATKPQPFKGTEANCIPVHYYNHKGAWMDREVYDNWFHKYFVPEVQAFLKETELPQKAVLLLDSAPSHPREGILTSNDDHIVVNFLPPNVTAILQPMNQGVIATMKRHFWADLLRTLADEDNSIKALWKKNYGVGCYIHHISGMVFHESSNTGSILEKTSSRSRRR
jgi:hypothetical protein